MKKFSKLLLLISFLLLIINVSSFGFIVYVEFFGAFYGDVLICGTSLLGACCAIYADDFKTNYYSKLFFFSHLTVPFLPFYYWSIAILI
ncbi:hypothetical protein [Metabacillus sediminilitoris]|uniref:Uncharacterized protein n=1 Tax=Metabacillus sediminilitoris TaxID=2567941 RepID=A0A4S4BQY1_9BACI|nr:hypothetical protein [Metabacillus sediminilitoris]QGQ46388.1 hypothetical protein GMB29_14875 [Metabacillus sediminilitoris]THF77375.1 hypothetical protein E6W99_18715 [Metabacillus sediminilitoris]